MKKILMLMIAVLLVGVLSACTEGGKSDVEKKYGKGITFKTEKFDETIDDEYLLYFMATSCVYCQKFRFVLKDYLKKDNALPIYAMDFDDPNGKEAARYFIVDKGWEIAGTPTLYYIKDGKPVGKIEGETELSNIPVKGSYEKLLDQDSKKEGK